MAQEDKARAMQQHQESTAAEGGVFGLAHIRLKIEAAVQEAAALPET